MEQIRRSLHNHALNMYLQSQLRLSFRFLALNSCNHLLRGDTTGTTMIFVSRLVCRNHLRHRIRLGLFLIRRIR